MTRRAWPRATIGVQLVLLLSGCLVVLHLVILAVVALTPPPRPPIYRVSEIATALEGGALTARDGRPMLRSTVATLPADFEPHRRGAAPALDALSAALGRPRTDVRLARHRPGMFDQLFASRRPVRIVMAHRHGPGPPQALDGPEGPGERGPRPPPGVRVLMLREAPVFGDFSAALRRPEGGWTIIRSSPEPFPTDWQRRVFLVLLAGFAVVAPAAFLFARRITAPLKRFSEAAERLGRDPHAAPVELSGPAEIGAAALAFNNMQSRLRRYIDDRTAMVGAISHDLRTPLARIRFRMESAPDDLKASVLGDVAQMEQMLRGVLAFIRDESTPRTRERLDLLSMLECVVDDAALVGGDVEIAEGDPVTVEGDPVALQRLFVNLVDNAVKYGRMARVSVRREGDLAVVEIQDAGDGLTDEDLGRVFQPFYRADPSRNVDSGGIGLGLPIARSTARAHGGDVELVASAPGLRARVTLPIA
jgi:signal transduction histidine kinase